MKNPKQALLDKLNRHGRPVTRRDFLARGLIGYSAWTLAPSLVAMLARQAHAQQGGASADKIDLPFITIDLAGGASSPGNFLVGGKGGSEDLLGNYDMLGWNPRSTMLDKRFGAAMAGPQTGARDGSQPISKMLLGMTQTASPEALANLRFGVLCHQGQDDSSGNLNSAALLVSKAGCRGRLIEKAISTSGSASGGRTQSPDRLPALKPVQIQAVSTLTESLGYGSIASELSSQSIASIFKTIAGLSGEQSLRLAKSNHASEFAALSQAGYAKNAEAKDGAETIDPRLDPNFQRLFNITDRTASNDRQVVLATILKNTIAGNAGPGVIELGGYDYHNDGLRATDELDRQAGIMMGRVVEAAHRMKRPVFFQLITDGGVYARRGSREWDGDGGDKSGTIIGYYKPDGAPKQLRTQVGHYLPGQGASRDSLIGADTARVGCAVLANYLAAAGRLGDYSMIAPKNILPIENRNVAKSLESLLVFGA